MTGQEYRVERDSMGEVKVPKTAYYGRTDTTGRREFSH